MRPAPSPTDIRVILPDLHGNFPALTQLLQAAGVLDEDLRRRDGYWVLQLGDLIHGAHEVTGADAQTLHLARDCGWVDVVLLGNHELPFVTSVPSRFAGMHKEESGRAQHPACQTELNRAMREGYFQPAVAVDGWLVTHAGLTPAHFFDDDGHKSAPDLRAAAVAADPAAALAAALNDRFETRIITQVPDVVMDGISAWRDGHAPAGSVFWADLRELLDDCRRYGNPVAQIVGHTPREADAPHRFELAGPLGDQPLWAIDLAGIDDGVIAALCKHPADTDWETVTIPRPLRPALTAQLDRS